MKVLSLWEPWATLAVVGHKKFETRSWKTKHRGQLLIHAAQKWSKAQKDLLNKIEFRYAIASAGLWPFKPNLGCIIGSVEIYDCIPTEDMSHYLDNLQRAFGDYSDGRFAWYMKNELECKPVHVIGRQRIFNYNEQKIEWKISDDL